MVEWRTGLGPEIWNFQGLGSSVRDFVTVKKFREGSGRFNQPT